MAVSSRGRNATNELLQISRKRETSPERTKIWTEPNTTNNNKKSTQRKVPVLYYLSRNGHLDHPHFMEVTLSSNHGLFLRDVINRLNVLRGKGMASLYSWSSKRSYKNGFVWHDLSEDDFIYPAHGQEYVLKGSELLDSKPLDKTSSFRAPKPPETNENDEFPLVTRRRNQSWSSIDLNEYKVYKTESSTSESTRRLAADVATQTDDKQRRRRRQIIKEDEMEEELDKEEKTELNRGEISPPPSDSSPETLESLMKADGRLVLCGSNEDDLKNNNFSSGRMKASSVLMQLISCGSISFRDCGATTTTTTTTSVKDQGLSLIAQFNNKGRLLPPRGGGTSREIGSFSRVRLEDKEYFSGSLIETTKEEVPALKRSNSYNADRTSQLQLAEKETEGVRAKCIPRKAKALPAKKEGNAEAFGESCSNSQQGPTMKASGGVK